MRSCEPRPRCWRPSGWRPRGVAVAEHRRIGDYVQRQYDAFVKLDVSQTTATGQSHLAAGGGYRYDYWRVAWTTFRDEPLHGVGAGNYGVPYFANRRQSEDIRQPHSIELQTLSELGIPGGLALLALIGCATTGLVIRGRRGRRGRRASRGAGACRRCGRDVLPMARSHERRLDASGTGPDRDRAGLVGGARLAAPTIGRAGRHDGRCGSPPSPSRSASPCSRAWRSFARSWPSTIVPLRVHCWRGIPRRRWPRRTTRSRSTTRRSATGTSARPRSRGGTLRARTGLAGAGGRAGAARLGDLVPARRRRRAARRSLPRAPRLPPLARAQPPGRVREVRAGSIGCRGATVRSRDTPHRCAMIACSRDLPRRNART